MGTLTKMRDHGSRQPYFMDLSDGRTFADPEGLRPIGRLEPTEFVLGDKGQPIRDGAGQMIHISTLANAAAEHYYTKVAEQYGQPVPYKIVDVSGEVRTMTAQPPRLRRMLMVGQDGKIVRQMADRDGRLVAMDLSIGDVHTAATLPNYAAGYHITDGIADIASPVVPVPKQSDVYYTWNDTTEFNRPLPVLSAPGAEAPEINPKTTPVTYTAPEYALGGFLPTEIQANADTPLQPFTKMMQQIVDKLRLEREIRVANAAQTSANWGSNQVITLTSGAQWDGGAASDPIANLHTAIENSMLPVTGIFWSEKVLHAFVRNPAVQKYFTFKDEVAGIPREDVLSRQLGLPPIHTAMMKYYTSSGTPTYVWGNHVVLTHEPAQMPPVNQMDVASLLTFRWSGGSAPDGSVTGGFLVRQFYDPRRGGRGGTKVIAVHNDTELQTSGVVGALILNAWQ